MRISDWSSDVCSSDLHFLAVLEQRRGVGDDLRIQRLRHLVAAEQRAVVRQVASFRLHQQRVEVEVVEMLSAAADLLQQVGAADDLVPAARAETGKNLADRKSTRLNSSH